MCFSATASFSAAAALAGLGLLTIKSARTRRETPFAAIPLLFAVQQLIEGVLWTSFHADAAGVTRAMTLAYLFFSHVLWPVFIPASVMLIEPSPSRRRDLVVLVGAGVAVSAWLAYQTLTHAIESHPEGKHIEYVLPLSLGIMTSVLYVLSTVASLVLSSHRMVRIFGVLTLAAFVATYAFYSHWWISVWCFFAALLSGVVLLHFKVRPPLLRDLRAEA